MTILSRPAGTRKRPAVRGAIARLALAALAVLAVLGGASACATGRTSPDRCKVRVDSLEQWSVRAGRADAAYRVSGEAGSHGKVWLAAEAGGGAYVSGSAVSVGPGPFSALVGIQLTAASSSYLAVLEVAGRRCRAKAPRPRS